MGRDLYESYACVRAVYDEASEVLGYDMAELSFHDPNDQIHLTRYTQPALLTHSIACLKAYEDQADQDLTPQSSAGHSLGAYCAQVTAGATVTTEHPDGHRAGLTSCLQSLDEVVASTAGGQDQQYVRWTKQCLALPGKRYS